MTLTAGSHRLVRNEISGPEFFADLGRYNRERAGAQGQPSARSGVRLAGAHPRAAEARYADGGRESVSVQGAGIHERRRDQKRLATVSEAAQLACRSTRPLTICRSSVPGP
jgi:hypothetical protein